MYIRGSEEILKPGEPAEYIRETGELAEPKKMQFQFYFLFSLFTKIEFPSISNFQMKNVRIESYGISK